MSTFTLLELFDGLICDEFQFHKQGICANYCISEPFILPASKGANEIARYKPGSDGKKRIITSTTPKLALHLNFKCKVGGKPRGGLNLIITAFHITARPATGQQTIDEHGPSILTAKESIHINHNTGWGPKENLTELVGVLDDPSEDDVLRVLKDHFTQDNVPGLVKDWKKKIEIKAQHSTKGMSITFHDSDKIFPCD